jgi:hypothetical protein
MKSERQIRQELQDLEEDLKFWRAKFEKQRDPDQRRIDGNTIIGVEGHVEALEWVLELHKEEE